MPANALWQKARRARLGKAGRSEEEGYKEAQENRSLS